MPGLTTRNKAARNSSESSSVPDISELDTTTAMQLMVQLQHKFGLQQVMSPEDAQCAAENRESELKLRQLELEARKAQHEAYMEQTLIGNLKNTMPLNLVWKTSKDIDVWATRWLTYLNSIETNYLVHEFNNTIRQCITGNMVSVIENPDDAEKMTKDLLPYSSGQATFKELKDLVESRKIPVSVADEVCGLADDMLDIKCRSGSDIDNVKRRYIKFVDKYQFSMENLFVFCLAIHAHKGQRDDEFGRFIESFSPFYPDKPELTFENYRAYVDGIKKNLGETEYKGREKRMERQGNVWKRFFEYRRPYVVEQTPDHFKRNAPDGESTGTVKRCSYCRMTGHTVYVCRRKGKRQDTGSADTPKVDDSKNTSVNSGNSFLVEDDGMKSSDFVLLDNCSSINIINDKSLFCGTPTDVDYVYGISGGQSTSKLYGPVKLVLNTVDGREVVWNLKCFYNPNTPNIVSAAGLSKGTNPILKSIVNSNLGSEGTATCNLVDGKSYDLKISVAPNGHPCLPLARFETAPTNETNDSAPLESTVQLVSEILPEQIKTISSAGDSTTVTADSTNTADSIFDFSALSVENRFGCNYYIDSGYFDDSSQNSAFESDAYAGAACPDALAQESSTDSASVDLKRKFEPDSVANVTSSSNKSRCLYSNLFGQEHGTVYSRGVGKTMSTMDDVRKFHLSLCHASKGPMLSMAGHLGYTVTTEAKKFMDREIWHVWPPGALRRLTKVSLPSLDSVLNELTRF